MFHRQELATAPFFLVSGQGRHFRYRNLSNELSLDSFLSGDRYHVKVFTPLWVIAIGLTPSITIVVIDAGGVPRPS